MRTQRYRSLLPLLIVPSLLLMVAGCSGSPPPEETPTAVPSQPVETPNNEGTDTPMLTATGLPESPSTTPAGTDTPGTAGPTPTTAATDTPGTVGPTPTFGPTPTLGPTPTDGPTPTLPPTGTDADHDGVSVEAGDCDDTKASVYPGATEVPYDGIDQDCNGSDLKDVDGDTHDANVVGGDDCDDNNANSYPGAQEYADGKDNDCDGKVDNHLDSFDDDQDGFSEAQGDCRDDDPTVNPKATEICNSVDDDCDGKTDADDSSATGLSTFYADADQDSFGDGTSSVAVCGNTAPVGYVKDATDCNDKSATVNPSATEACNGIDDDCDKKVDDADTGVTGQLTYYADADADTYGSATSTVKSCASSAPAGYVSRAGDCNDSVASINPAGTETCNNADDDCDGSTDEGVQTTFYQDGDGDGYGNPSKTAGACSVPTGYVTNANDCKDTNDQIYPGATEACNGVDDDCDGVVDDGAQTTWYRDADGDGFGTTITTTQACTQPSGYVSNALDCNDSSATIKPGAVETCNGVDDNCDGISDEGASSTWYQDADADGYGNPSTSVKACAQPAGFVSNAQDCNDTNASIKPGATELCNGVDDDCDSVADDGVKLTWYQDADGDSYGNPAVTTQACTRPTGYAGNNTDCNDAQAAVNPGATETCNSLDDNCNGQTDEGVKSTFYQDADADGFGNISVSVQACSKPSGYVTNASDCNDANASIKPGATETCNGVDDDCDTVVDDGVKLTWYQDADSDGYGNLTSSTQACSKPTGYVSTGTDCNDTNAAVNPGATETCNGVDDNCSGQTDEGVKNTYYQDADGDSYGNLNVSTQACSKPSGYVTNASDCNDSSAAIKPGATETCNGVDDDCDTVIDDGVKTTWYQDADNDTYGNLNAPTQACSKPTGYVTNTTDCDDTKSSVNPGATETCNGTDDNCNGTVDEGVKTTFYQDADADTYGNPSVTTQACTAPGGYVTNNTDCNDTNAAINPGKTELQNGIDDNCNSQIDEGFAGFSTSFVQHTGTTKAMYTKCETVTNGGKTCNNPEIKYGNLAGGIPYQHSGNQLTTWCQQLGFTSNTAVTYGTRDVTAPKGRLFGCTSYDESAWHWCDWQDGYWYNQSLDYHTADTTAITSITCQ